MLMESFIHPAGKHGNCLLPGARQIYVKETSVYKSHLTIDLPGVMNGNATGQSLQLITMLHSEIN